MSGLVLDSAKILETVREKVRSAIIDAIPEEAWKEMVAREIKDFTTGSSDRYSPRASGLSLVVKSVMEEETKKRVRDALAGPDWAPYWGGQTATIGPEMTKLISECGPAILQAMLSQAVQSIMLNAQNNLGQNQGFR